MSWQHRVVAKFSKNGNYPTTISGPWVGGSTKSYAYAPGPGYFIDEYWVEQELG
ncbi:hypothetical protein ACFQ68_08570 [Amycolatopsis japonica]|uniref:hypothetical protein n=1 Tax=Amycolatopsis japonica TaxID=208439 RepID=UPI0036719071